jgi:two-component system response regulator
LLHLNDGAEALNFVFAKKSFENKRIQNDLKLVLLDLKLPKIDGLEILKRIREDERTRTLPVVILTSSREKKDIVTAYNLGVNSYVVKPVEFEFYVHVVKTLTLYWNTINEKPIGQI